MELFFAIIGGIIFLPLIKLHAMSNSKKVKNLIVLFLILILVFTLRGCASTLNSIANDSSKISMPSVVSNI